jgi:Fe-S oxidoreductase
MNIDNLAEILKNCGSCNYCRDTCPMYIELKSELDSPGGKLRALRAYATKMRDPPIALLQKLYCADCRRCEAICPAGVPVTEIWSEAKIELLKSGGVMSETMEKVLDWIDKEGTPFIGFEAEERTFWAEDLDLPSESKTAIFAGCMGSFWYPDKPESVVNLLQKMDCCTGYIPNEICCGLFNHWAGDEKGFEKVAHRNYEMFKKAGVERIVTNCGGCFGTLVEHYPRLIPEFGVKVLHSVQVLAEEVKKGTLTFEGIDKSYTFHDSCHLGRALGIYEEPRDIIKAIPDLEFVEMEYNRNCSNCCGGFLSVLDPDIAESVGRRRVAEAEELEVDGIITTCISCHKNLSYGARNTKLEVIQLDDLILDKAKYTPIDD